MCNYCEENTCAKRRKEEESIILIKEEMKFGSERGTHSEVSKDFTLQKNL